MAGNARQGRSVVELDIIMLGDMRGGRVDQSMTELAITRTIYCATFKNSGRGGVTAHTDIFMNIGNKIGSRMTTGRAARTLSQPGMGRREMISIICAT